MRTLLFTLVAISLVGSPVALAEQGGTINASTELRAAPASDAKVLSKLAKGSAIQVLKRQSGWYQGRVNGGATGWVKMLRVSFASAGGSASSGGGGLSALGKLVRGSSDGIHVGTGVRGLGEEDLRGARPNIAELKKLKKYRSSESEARQFAGQGKLASKQVASLQKEKGDD